MQTTAGVRAPTTMVQVDMGEVVLPGALCIPRMARGVVVFAHGSGSGHHSPRNNAVARVLQGAGLATLLLDLLTERESHDPVAGFDIDLRTRRLLAATGWVRQRDDVLGLPTGYFGGSTGAAAALSAAAQDDGTVAVVSRGGRPDLTTHSVADVTAPTLLIVGGHDEIVLDRNVDAFASMGCEKHLEVVPDATHLFEEPGALDRVATLARDWFLDHLGASGRSA